MKIFYKEHKKRTQVDVIDEQKWNVILGILWLAYYNSEIDQRIKKVKMTRYLEECKRQ